MANSRTPCSPDPKRAHVEQGLSALDWLVVQDVFLSETAQLAHVLLPAAASLEKDGAVTNTERRVQLLAPPGDAWPGWKIVAALGAKLEQKLGRGRGNGRVNHQAAGDGQGVGFRAPPGAGAWAYSSTAAIMDELARVTPIYAGLRHSRLAGTRLVWPCPSENHLGTPLLHAESFTRGLGKFHPVAAWMPVEQPDAEYPLILTTGRILYHYHTGTKTRRSDPLAWREPRGYAEINKADVEKAALKDGGALMIRSRRGAVGVQARVSRRVPPGVAFYSFHWKQAPANTLARDLGLDQFAKIPELKVCVVRLESAKGKQAA